MKNYLLFVFAATALLFSCGDNDNENIDSDSNEIQNLDVLGEAEMNELSLVEEGLNMKLLLPEVASSTGASIEPLVTHDDGDYLWFVDIGSHFHLVIEDFAKEKGKVEDEKKRLSNLTNIFNIEYVLEEENVIMYKRELHEGQGGKTTYHCYGVAEIEGYTFVLRSTDDGGLKPVINDMVTTIKSAKEVKNA
jgi:hypothetical protein